jgi:hypothetical protein
LERLHSENTDPRVLRTICWWRQLSHSPAGGETGRSVLMTA